MARDAVVPEAATSLVARVAAVARSVAPAGAEQDAALAPSVEPPRTSGADSLAGGAAARRVGTRPRGDHRHGRRFPARPPASASRTAAAPATPAGSMMSAARPA